MCTLLLIGVATAGRSTKCSPSTSPGLCRRVIDKADSKFFEIEGQLEKKLEPIAMMLIEK